jgi:pimeloyl-ACP methyl ester carboxylesterase
MTGHAGSWRGRRIPILIALLVAAAGLAGCTRRADRDQLQASITVSPQAALEDQPVAVTVHGLPAGARTTLTAKATDTDGIAWSSSAEFQATSAGTVSLDQPSLGGSYTGVSPMGLFTRMTPPPGSTAAAFFHGPAGYDVELEASVSGRVAATTMAKRQGPTAVGVTEKQLRPTKGRIYGNLYLPRHITGRRPAALVFSGSAGGLTTSFAAALLAAHGYPSLALAYFKTPGLPQTLSSIPLEYFTSALEELRAQPGVDRNHVLVAGESRGGEAALLLGAHFPRLVNGVIAGVPSSVVNPGWPDTSNPAWTLHGHPLPAVSPSGTAKAVIPVERIRGPVLLTWGEQDRIWPSCAYVDAITVRLRGQGFAYPVTALRYRDAGHLIGGLTAYYGQPDRRCPGRRDRGRHPGRPGRRPRQAARLPRIAVRLASPSVGLSRPGVRTLPGDASKPASAVLTRLDVPAWWVERMDDPPAPGTGDTVEPPGRFPGDFHRAPSRHPGSVRSLQATQHQDVHGGRDGERRGAARARPRVVP